MEELSGVDGELAAVRARARAAGLNLDDDRLRALGKSMQATENMIAAIERVQIDPVDLAVGLFDPAWPKEGRRR